MTTAASGPTTIAFTGVFYACSETAPDALWASGDKIVHIRGAGNHNLWVTTTPLLNGFLDNVVDAEINIESGKGVGQ